MFLHWKERIDEVLATAMMGAVFFLILMFLGKILTLCAPLVTSLVMGSLYLKGFKRNPFLATGGVLLYIASWFAVEPWGVATAQVICGIGLLAWIMAPWTPSRHQPISVRA